MATLDRATPELVSVPERSAAVQPLLEEGRSAVALSMPRHEIAAELAVSAVVLVAATAIALLVPPARPLHAAVVVLFAAAYAVTSLVEIDLGSGYGMPTQLVFVPMLFALPVTAAPFVAIGGWTLARVPQWVSGRRHPSGVSSALANGAYTLGPALVLGLAGITHPTWSAWPLLTAALVAQLGCDSVGSLAREWMRIGSVPRVPMRLLGEIYLTDVSLTPVALGIALLATRHPAAVLVTLPLTGLLSYFSRERRARLQHAVELSRAYRGTALLLGDLVEADDAYTGSHSRDVVDLALACAPRMKLDPDQLRNLEFAALLHDVGKIHIPKSIINKPAALTDEERAVINTHTIEGEQMLLNVGGVLGDVGRIVRSCHERPDGLGYPDGLSGDEIPVEARIVACCDAFNAMTTDRPYRKALSLDDALDELRAQSGKQFDPDVVDALLALYPGR